MRIMSSIITSLSETGLARTRAAPVIENNDSLELERDEDLADGVDSEIYQLKLTNIALMKEVSQVKADKEFVWSLWKRLQVANPNIGAAMEIVVQREREKAEVKDEKVLRILEIKDSKIEELGKEVLELTSKLEKETKDGANVIMERENMLKEKNLSVTEVINLREELEKLRTEQNELKKEKDKSERELKRKEAKCKQASEVKDKEIEKLNKKLEKNLPLLQQSEDVSNKLQDQIKVSNACLEDAGKKYESLAKEHSEAKNLLVRMNNERAKDKEVLEFKEKELESVREELVKLWDKHHAEEEKSKSQAEMINQLQQLQINTQNIIKNQEAAFDSDASNLKRNFELLKEEMKRKFSQTETEKENLKACEAQMVRENDNLRKQVEELRHPTKEKEVQASVMTKRDYKVSQVSEAVMECEFELLHLKNEQVALREKLQEKNRIITELELNSNSDKENLPVINLKEEPRRFAKCSKNNFSESANSLQKKLDKLTLKQRESEALLKSKQQLLHSMEMAHDNRAERMKLLQKELEELNTRIVKTLGDSEGKFLFLSKFDVDELKQLKTKDSDKLWKEIVYLRKENQTLIKEKIDVTEEMDLLKVNLAKDEVIIAANKFEVEEAEQMWKAKLQIVQKPVRDAEKLEKIILGLDDKMSAKEATIQNVEQKLKVREKENQDLEQEIFNVGKKFERQDLEITILKNELSDKRMENTDLRRETLRARTGFDRERAKASEFEAMIDQREKEIEKLDSEWHSKYLELKNIVQIQPICSSSKRDMEKESDSTELSPVEGSDCTFPGKLDNENKDEATTESDLEALKTLKKNFKSETARLLTQKTSTKKLDSLKKQNVLLTKQLQALKKNNNASKSENDALLQEVEKLKCESEDLNNHVEDCKKKLADKNGDLKTLQDKLSQDQTELQSLTQEQSNLKKSEQDCRVLTAQHKNLKAENDRLNVLLKDSKAEIVSRESNISELLDKVKNLERECCRKRALIEDQKMKFKALKTKQEETNSDQVGYGNKIKSLEDSIKNGRIQIESLKQKMAAAIKEKNETEAGLADLENRFASKEKELKRTMKKYEGTEKNFTEFEQLASKEMSNLVEASESKFNEIKQQLLICKNHNLGLVKELRQFTIDANEMHFKWLEKASKPSANQVNVPLPTPRKGLDVDQVILSNAKRRAGSILQLSDADMDDIMNTLSHSSDDGTVRTPGKGTRDLEPMKEDLLKWLSAMHNTIDLAQNETAKGLRVLLLTKIKEITSDIFSFKLSEDGNVQEFDLDF